MVGEYPPPPLTDNQTCVKQNVEAFMQVILFLESTKKVQLPVFSEDFFYSKKILSQNKGMFLVEL